MALLHKNKNPYLDFNPSPSDLQGWGSYHPIFQKILSDLKPSLIIEVGTWKGASAIHMANLSKELKMNSAIVCVDTWLGNWQHWDRDDGAGSHKDLNTSHGYPTLYYQFISNVINLKCTDVIIPFPIHSIGACYFFSKKNIQPNLVYIDGDHEYESVFLDISRWYEILAEDGLLLLDDYDWPGVSRACHELSIKFNYEFDVHNNKAVIKKKNNLMTGTSSQGDKSISDHGSTPDDPMLSNYLRDRYEYQPWLQGEDKLTVRHAQWHALLKTYANAEISSSSFVSLEAKIFTDKLSLGNSSYVAANTMIRGHVSIGENSSVNMGCNISGSVRIGNAVRIGSGVNIIGFNHAYQDKNKPIAAQGLICKGVRIGNDVWIGSNAIICDGVTIEDGTVVAAGSVVSKTIPEGYCLIAGNPARLIKNRQ